MKPELDRGQSSTGQPESPLIDGRYQVESELGRGAMGVVYLARDVWLRRAVAVKVIAPALPRDPAAVNSFLQEAMALASVRSQHVVQVYAFGPHEGSYFSAMEHIRGRSLHEIIAEHRRHGAFIPVHRALTILSRIADGLTAVHQAGILHRDVKPENIVIEEDTGRPVLVDFGLAAPSDVGLNLQPAGGSPAYMAPEQAGCGVPGRAVTARADLYAFGCTAFELLTGRLPFEASDPVELIEHHARTPPPVLSSVRRELAPFDVVFTRALAKDPLDRYESCAEMASALMAAGAAWKVDEPSSIGRLSEGDRPRRVLVVDDDPAFGRFAARAVELVFQRHVQVSVTGTGAQAIAIAEQARPDLVLLDYDMPDLDGIDTLSRLRALPGGDRVRVLVLSTEAGIEVSRWRFSILGVKDFVAKPVGLQALAERVEVIADRSGWRLGMP
jgi:eukaryotic-like serine/threonine-protein kinase